jgi:RNA polymerase sigma factor (sigma-70 family)
MTPTDLELVTLFRHGNQAAFTTLARRHDDLIRSHIRHFHHDGYDRDDLRQHALLALWKASREHDFNSGATFRTFASKTIRHRLLDLVARHHGPKYRLAIKRTRERDETSHEKALRVIDPRANVHDIAAARADLQLLARQLMPELTARERQALADHLNDKPHQGAALHCARRKATAILNGQPARKASPPPPAGYGLHVRHHVNRNMTNPACPFCEDA